MADLIQRLQGCYACTDWDVFINSAVDQDECSDVILDCMRFCQEICMDNKQMTVYANENEKPWFVTTCDHNYVTNRTLTSR